MSVETHSGDHFKAADVGPWDALARHRFDHPKLGPVRGKLFLKEILGLTSMEASVGILPPGVGLPFLHKHRQSEELYLIVKGSGQFQIDGKTIEVKEGSVIRVSPEGARTWRGGPTEPMVYVCIQARKDSFESVTTEDGVGLKDPVVWSDTGRTS